MIELKHFQDLSHGRRRVSSPDDINLTIRDGDIFGIVGMSGAGKSTLVRCINLLERPTAGQVVIDGQDLMELSAPSCGRSAAHQHDLPAVQPAHAAHLPGQHLLPHGDRRVPRGGAQARPEIWTSWACPTRPTPTWPSSGGQKQRTPSPAPWPPIPRCCAVTRPPPP